MTPTDPNEFTDREKLVLSYYRAPAEAVSRHTWLYDSAIGIGSLICLFLSVSREDSVLGFVAYALVFGRWCHVIIEGGRWNKDFRSIFAKYAAKVRALEAEKVKSTSN